jgi:hypothetical protein
MREILMSIFGDTTQTLLFVASLLLIVVFFVRKIPRWVWSVLWALPQLSIVGTVTFAFLWALQGISPYLAETPRNAVWKGASIWLLGALAWTVRILSGIFPKPDSSKQPRRVVDKQQV